MHLRFRGGFKQESLQSGYLLSDMVKVYGRYVNVMKYDTYSKLREEQNSLMRLLEGRGFMNRRFLSWL
ncbi:hypothetical protein C5G87_06715 [Paenibacillus peoriae]|nr:hypothetical protein CG775_02395 [Paenibacillus polymyxa]PPQ49065.1 hypothetical protein C5G87_06715 [Paenibacillus peoriae]